MKYLCPLKVPARSTILCKGSAQSQESLLKGGKLKQLRKLRVSRIGHLYPGLIQICVTIKEFVFKQVLLLSL